MMNTPGKEATLEAPLADGFFAYPRGQEPIRAELYGVEHLEAHARRLAGFSASAAVVADQRLLARSRDNSRALIQAHHVITEAYRRKESFGTDAEWLLDNFHIIADALSEVQTDLPRSYYQQLPKLVSGSLSGFPRIYGLAIELVSHSDSSLDETIITRFVQAYQVVTPLTIGELWAIPTMFRLVLIENLRRLAEQILSWRLERQEAEDWASHFRNVHERVPLSNICDLAPPSLRPERDWTHSFLVHLLELLRDHPTTRTSGTEWVEHHLTVRGLTAPDILRWEQQRQAANQVSIGNSVTSLRLLSALDWSEFFERVSLVEASLRQDPAGVYAHQDFATRNRYRQMLEKLARGSGAEELEVSRRLMALAGRHQEGQPPADRNGSREKETMAVVSGARAVNHVGYYLIDKGLIELETVLGYRPALWDHFVRVLLAHAQGVYFGALALIVALILVGVTVPTSHLWHGSAGAIFFCLVIVSALVPASELALGLVNHIVSALVPPRVLPKLQFKTGIPADCATFVVMPTMLVREQSAAVLLERLEIHYLSNPDPQLRFALLTDLADAAEEHMPEDEGYVQGALDGIKALNDRYCKGGPDRFFLCHRRRLWNPLQGCWMGWERKRGKLLEFNRLLRGDRNTSFIVLSGDVNQLGRIRYVITLDADTQLPREAAERLIGTLAHPLNQPRIDPEQKRVSAGYGVLQPRISLSLPGSKKSLFARTYAHSAGLDPYTTAVSDTYQDLFASGSFTGKGIYDVDTFEAVVGHTFPDSRILSHDLIEGNYVRCGLATDIEMLDEFPALYSAYARREYRWARGDWQILDWLFPTVPGPDGRRRPNPLGLVERWKIFDNLRRSLLPPSLLALLFLGWLIGANALWFATGLVLAVIGWPLLVQLISVPSQLLRCLFRGNHWYALSGRVSSTAGQAFLGTIFLANHARLMLDAMLRTLIRLYVTRRNSLEWETSAAAERRSGTGLADTCRSMWQAPVMAIALALPVAALRPTSLPLAAPFLLAWLVSPLVAFWVSRPRPTGQPVLSPQGRRELHRLALKTWSFFENCVGAEDHWLPPDNYQEDLKEPLAHRTSPTNVGLYLLSSLAAHDFGYLTLAALAERLEKTFATLTALERIHGHLYNWYDTRTLRPLQPSYISTVDSGNFLACLLVLKEGLLEKTKETIPPPSLHAGLKDSLELIKDRREELSLAGKEAATALHERLKRLAQEADKLATEMDFKILYNDQRHLFSVGYNVSLGRLDNAHYDLLASEACITSFLAIARGDVPKRHWFQVGRPVTRVGGSVVLLSWGGTMFEYLMPRLLLPSFPDTLLTESQQAAVARQIKYGKQMHVPWGISESAFSAVDRDFNYQYQAFGVPGLGLKRGLGKDLVIAPYATFLALLVAPQEAVKNLNRISKEGGEGRFGFYEAIDYTRERLQPKQRAAVVKCFMAHHQGMSMLALANCLLGNLMQRRFHAVPMVRATELLLQERVPQEAPVTQPNIDEIPLSTSVQEDADLMSRHLTTPHTAHPRTHMLSSGQYTVMITGAGGGYGACRSLDVTRWREDRTRDSWGQFCYLRDLRAGVVWSAGFQPVCREPDDYSVVFSTDKAEIRRVDSGIETYLEITTSPENPAEVRRLTITNHNSRKRFVEVTSYAEIVLAPHAADLAHPAFGKLFLETEYVAAQEALLCRRRPRSADQKPIWGIHVMAVDGPTEGFVQYETDRARFLGRGRTPANPAALDAGAFLSGTTGPVLDPIFSLRRWMRIAPGTSVCVAFTTAVADSREEAIALADRFHDFHGVSRAFELAWAHSQVELRHLHLTARQAHVYQRLAAHVIYAGYILRAAPTILAANRQGQSALWRHGISGDNLIVLVRISEAEDLALAREILAAHNYWRLKGLNVDIVILNEHEASYFEDLQQQLLNLVRSSDDRNMIDKPGGVFLRKGAAITREDLILLQAAARCVLIGTRGSLTSQLDRLERQGAVPERLSMKERRKQEDLKARKEDRVPKGPDQPKRNLLFANGLGGFSADGREYVIQLAVPDLNNQADGRDRSSDRGAHREIEPLGLEFTPAPWINVVANPQFGFLVSESGAGYTWANNSQQNRLTPWNNDPVSDSPGEAVYLRDQHTGEFWSAAPRPISGQAPHVIRHGQGFTQFEHTSHGLGHELLLFVPLTEPIKFICLKVRNLGKQPRKLAATFFAEWVLGSVRDASLHVVTEIDLESGALLARNSFNADFGSSVAFADVSLRPRSFTADRTEFLGRNGSLTAPAAFNRTELTGTVGAALDPCAALQTQFELKPGEQKEIVFYLGEAASQDEVRRLLGNYRKPGQVALAFREVKHWWEQMLTTVQVRTPNPGLDLLINRWLPYQVLSCRVWGRSALYQSGGAYGFRDQLQDVMALVYAAPQEARAQILRAAGRQFLEGDVQHWWHPASGAGVRTRFSDDFLWLPFVVCHYVGTTGDVAILDEQVSFLQAPTLRPEQEEDYRIPAVSEERAPLYEHCVRAIENGFRLGAHGLPLMGTGDWNDGMNRIGNKGQGESVWNGWFLLTILRSFAELAEGRNNTTQAALYRARAAQLLAAIETHAWDGKWYRRAYFDDGTPLGSAENEECRIDSITQSWAVIAGGADPQRVQQAMASAEEWLVREADKLILLFTPAFDHSKLEPGYVKGYVPGIRENGGQYTHAAAWMVQANALMGHGDRAMELFDLLNPINHSSAPADVEQYRVEPYVVAGDIYSQPSHLGRGGWTWYSGSAGWLYRIALETILGFQLRGTKLFINPCIPRHWQDYEITYRYRSATYVITVAYPNGVDRGVRSVTLDGETLRSGAIPLVDDGKRHQVRIAPG
jgi:cyclic beta-1,2-glucan synthetase